MYVILFNGQAAPVGGWYGDAHGHRLFLSEGDLAPICPHLGPTTVQWRLIQPVGSPRA